MLNSSYKRYPRVRCLGSLPVAEILRSSRPSSNHVRQIQRIRLTRAADVFLLRQNIDITREVNVDFFRAKKAKKITWDGFCFATPPDAYLTLQLLAVINM